MTDEKKQELFPYFAYIYSQKLNPEKYGSTSDIEEWTSLIQDSQEDIDAITQAAGELTDDDWDALDQQYTAQINQTAELQTQFAKKGAKLKNLKAQKGIAFEKGTTKSYSRTELMKKGGKKKKCECGCEVITKKENGGQLVDICSCCGKVHNNIVKAQQGVYFTMPGQKPYKVNPIIPKHEFISPETLMGQIASIRPTKPAQSAELVSSQAQSTAPTSVNLSTAVPDYTQQVNPNDKIRKYAFNDLGTTIFKKGGLVKKKQAGGSSESSSSQLGVARKGAKIKSTDRIKKAQDGNKIGKLIPGKNTYSKGKDVKYQDNTRTTYKGTGQQIIRPNSSGGADTTYVSSKGVSISKPGFSAKVYDKIIGNSPTQKEKWDAMGKAYGKNPNFKEKGGKVKSTDRIKKAQAGSKLKYNPNKPYSKINYDGNAYNKDLEGMKKTSIDSLQTYNRSNTNESDSRNAKQLLSDLRSGKSKMPKKETGGKAPMPTRKVALTKASLKKEEKRNAEISKPDNILKPNRIGKAKIDKVKCGKKLKFKK